MNKYTLNVILQPENNKKYNGRRYLTMDVTAFSRIEAIEKAYGYLEGLIEDFVKVIIS